MLSVIGASLNLHLLQGALAVGRGFGGYAIPTYAIGNDLYFRPFNVPAVLGFSYPTILRPTDFGLGLRAGNLETPFRQTVFRGMSEL